MMGRDYAEDDEDGEGFYESGNVRDQPSIGDNSGLEPDAALEALDLQDLMLEGRKLLLQKLIAAVKQGIASPQEMNTLRQMLKDNGMVMGDPNEGATPGQGKPKAPLPQFGEPDYLRRK